MKKTTSGFTIVELLIVIVTIGVIASIAIVAYNGIQTRAQNTRLLSAFDTYEKALRQYKALNGNYPAYTPPGSELYACLGTSFPATADFALDKCYVYNGTNYATKSTQVNTALLTVLSGLPDTSSYVLHLSSGGDTYHLRGIHYLSGGLSASLMYYIQGNQTCGRGTPTPMTIGSTTFTMCSLDII
ncbi:Type II secretion system protein G precursor [compost metagenome]